MAILQELTLCHYNDVIKGAIASQITSLPIFYSAVYSDAVQRKHLSSASLAIVRWIHRWPVNSTHKLPVTRKMFPFDDVIMYLLNMPKVLLICVVIMAFFTHYRDVIMGAISSQINSFTIVYSTVYSGADQRKHQGSAPLAFWGNSSVTGEFPAQMASNAENVSIWWRHHVLWFFCYSCTHTLRSFLTGTEIMIVPVPVKWPWPWMNGQN